MGQMSYESEEMIKCNLSYHYDFWTKDNPNEGAAGIPDGIANAMQDVQSVPIAKTGAISLNSVKASIVSV